MRTSWVIKNKKVQSTKIVFPLERYGSGTYISIAKRDITRLKKLDLLDFGSISAVHFWNLLTIDNPYSGENVKQKERHKC